MARKFCENLHCPQPLSSRRRVTKCRIAGTRHMAYLCAKCEQKNLEYMKIIPINPLFRKSFERFMKYVRIKIAAGREPPTVFGRSTE